MSCERFDEGIVGLARGENGDDAVRRAALAHAEQCPRCAERLADERAVTSALRALATRTAAAEAPPRVEAALRGALRQPEKRSTDGAWTFRKLDLLWLAAAATGVAAILIVPPLRDPGPETAPPPAPALIEAAAEPEESAEFVALRYGEDLRDLDSLQVVSVELPHAALAALGWPAAEGTQESVRAEVIVGHDGVARAIRFVD